MIKQRSRCTASYLVLKWYSHLDIPNITVCTERRLKCYGLVLRREGHYVGRWAMEIKYKGDGRQYKLREWLDKVKDDIKEKGLSADDMYDRATWRCMLSYI